MWPQRKKWPRRWALETLWSRFCVMEHIDMPTDSSPGSGCLTKTYYGQYRLIWNDLLSWHRAFTQDNASVTQMAVIRMTWSLTNRILTIARSKYTAMTKSLNSPLVVSNCVRPITFGACRGPLEVRFRWGANQCKATPEVWIAVAHSLLKHDVWKTACAELNTHSRQEDQCRCRSARTPRNNSSGGVETPFPWQ